jgi:hypothetical protein
MVARTFLTTHRRRVAQDDMVLSAGDGARGARKFQGNLTTAIIPSSSIDGSTTSLQGGLESRFSGLGV